MYFFALQMNNTILVMEKFSISRARENVDVTSGKCLPQFYFYVIRNGLELIMI